MAKYIQFKTEDKNFVLVEVDENKSLQLKPNELQDKPGPSKVGLVSSAISQVETVFENAVKKAVKLNVDTFYAAIQDLSHPPTDIEITFGLKAVGELSNIAIGKLNAESNYSIKLTWKSNPAPPA